MNFKQLNKGVCTLGLAALYTFTTYGATITDVTSGHWAYKSIMTLESKGIMSLTSSGQFFPNQLMDYFEFADVLAKATGYVDGDVVADADPTLLSQIAANYERQKPTLQKYATKYKNWNSAYNQQIAYLLGRGYLTVADLDNFMIQSGNTYVKNVLTKEVMSIFVVRMLGKEVTAKESYTTTGFKDEAAIGEGARPYMAYLKEQGIITADALGKGNGKTKVSKALCAKIIESALEVKGTIHPNNGTTQEETVKHKEAIVKKVLTKNKTEYYLLLQEGEDASYYSIKNTTKIVDEAGNEVAITRLAGEKLAVTVAMEGSTEYITSACLMRENKEDLPQQGGESRPEQDNKPEQEDRPEQQETIVEGTLVQPMTSNICRLTLADGGMRTYLLESDCTLFLDGKAVEPADLKVGDIIVAQTVGSMITRLQATSGTPVQTPPAQMTEGKVISKKLTQGSYTFTLKNGEVEGTVTIPETATIARNLKVIEASSIRLGDTLKLTIKEGKITQVAATGEKSRVEGTINQIIIGATSQVVVNVDKVPKTYTLASQAEVYDAALDEVISVRDLHLGQKASLLLDSEEVIVLDVDSDQDSVNIMGKVSRVGHKASTIDLLVDYDPVTGENQVYKRMALNHDVKVIYNGKSREIYDLEEGMDIVVTYKYLDDLIPQQIIILS